METSRQLGAAVFEYIEVFYNRECRYSTSATLHPSRARAINSDQDKRGTDLTNPVPKTGDTLTKPVLRDTCGLADKDVAGFGYRRSPSSMLRSRRT